MNLKKNTNYKMKNYSAAFFLLIISGCAVLQKGVSYFGEEKIFSKYFKTFTTYKREAQGREPGWELGIAFIPHKDGRISGVWLKNPTTGNVPVSIWDADTKQLIQTIQCTVTDTIYYNHYSLQQPLQITAGKKYCITANVTRYYYHILPYNNLPLQFTNCTLVSSVYEETYSPRYPQYELNNIVHGLLDIDLDWKQ
jgi:hypothetical protein